MRTGLIVILTLGFCIVAIGIAGLFGARPALGTAMILVGSVTALHAYLKAMREQEHVLWKARQRSAVLNKMEKHK